jgi:hypothetical protein
VNLTVKPRLGSLLDPNPVESRDCDEDKSSHDKGKPITIVFYISLHTLHTYIA